LTVSKRVCGTETRHREKASMLGEFAARIRVSGQYAIAVSLEG
jgi:hypothetical protein